MSASVKRGAGAGAKPWWIGGYEDKGQWTQLPDNVTAEQMLRLAGISHNVSKVPMYCFASVADYHAKRLTMVPGVYSMVRKNEDGTTEPLSGVSVGEDYSPIQIFQAFEFGDSLISASKDGEAPAHWHTAGELLDNTIWALAKLDKEIYVAGDRIEAYFLMTTRHDGKSAFRVKLSNARVVCSNTLAMATRDGSRHDYSIKHTAGYKDRMEEARKILRLTTKAQESWEKLANQLLEVPVQKGSVDFKRLMEHLFPTPENLQSLDNINQQRVMFNRVLHRPDLDNIKETGWGIVNAAADYEQHFKVIRSTDKDKIVETLFKRSFGSDAPSSLVTKAKEFVLSLS